MVDAKRFRLTSSFGLLIGLLRKLRLIDLLLLITRVVIISFVSFRRQTHELVCEDASHHCCALSNSLVCIKRLMQVINLEVFFEPFLDPWSSSRTTHNNDLIYLIHAHLGILEGFFDRLLEPSKYSLRCLFVICTIDFHLEVVVVEDRMVGYDFLDSDRRIQLSR